MTSAADALLARGKDGAPAVIAGEHVVTYGELRARVADEASRLAAAGLARGDRVALLADTGAWVVAAYLGCLRAGGVAVPLPTPLAPERLRPLLVHTGARFGIADAAHARRLEDAGAGLLERLWVGPPPVAEVRPGGAAAAPDPAETGGVAAIVSTSGSTGDARGVVVTHDNLVANTDAIAAALALGDRDRALLVLPWYYCYGASILHTHLRVGASVTLGPSVAYAERALDALEDTGATGLYGVPSTFQVLLRRSTLADRRLPSLRYLAQAGGRLPEAPLRALAELPSRPDVYVMYGQTEATARLSILPARDLAERPGSIGRGLPGTRLEVLAPGGRPVWPGEVGEIVARGPGVTRGYWRDPDETAKWFRDGALHTGDLATVDEDGYIFVRGRERDFLKVAGVRVAAAEIEDVLNAHPDVVEVAVVGAPDPLLGEAAIAHAVLRPGAEITAAQLIAHCRRTLPIEKIPRRVDFWDDLPRTPTGKLARGSLHAQASGRNRRPSARE